MFIREIGGRSPRMIGLKKRGRSHSNELAHVTPSINVDRGIDVRSEPKKLEPGFVSTLTFKGL